MPTWKERFVGDGERYNYGAMCVPNVPCMKQEPHKVNFYTKDEKIPIFMATIMGLQHSFAMVGGLITVPYVIFRFTICFTCVDQQQQAIAAGLIASGITSIINVTKIPIPMTKQWFGRQLYIGSGVLSVMGTSFTFLPIFEIGIRQQTADGVDAETAYGRMLGTSMLCCLLELFFSVMPLLWVKKIFPPIVTSITVILIGVALTGTGMKYWAGGAVCADMIWKQHEQITPEAAEFISPVPSAMCENGEVLLGYGASQFVGLGFSVMAFLVLIEVFGSVFMKNCNVIIALLFGYLVAGLSDYNGAKYVASDRIKDAEPFTFLWVDTFPLGLYGPAVIPLLIAYLVTTVETVGDISAVYEVSDLDTETIEYSESLQGGLTSDSLASILAGLFMTMPNTTFSQNNGVIALTKCASRRAGYACGMWLIFMGVFSKVAGIITSIPDCVLGGMTIFLFANVLVSGISLASTLDIHSRRVKFIMACSLAIGVGVTVWPFAFQDMRGSAYTANFWRCADCSDTVKGLRNGVSIFLSTGYCVGTVVAMLLNFILPEDAGVNIAGVEDDQDEVDAKVLESEGDDTPEKMEEDDAPVVDAFVEEEDEVVA
jgi:NCS2 family nucleobase:cation symporter-2